MKVPDDMALHITKGNATFGDWQILFKFAENRKVKVELGTAHGFSAMLLSKHNGFVYTIDNHKFYTNRDKYKPNEKYQIIKDFLTLYSDVRIKTIINDTVLEAKNWENESVDLLYIDGGHSFEQVEADYNAWYPKVKEGSVILFHDVSPNTPDVFKFYNEVLVNDLKIRELIQKPEFETTIKVFVKEKQ